MGNLFVLIGLPGSGKTTFANAMMESGKNIVYLSSDELRKEYIKDKDNHVVIFNEMHRRTLENLNAGNDVIYDSTNLEIKFRKNLFDKVKAMYKDSKVYAIFIHKGLENAILQSHGRAGREDVNDDLISQMYQTMQLPSIGIDCDSIIMPEINFVNDRYRLTGSKIFGISNFNDFLNEVQKTDRSLVLKYNKEFEEDKDEI